MDLKGLFTPNERGNESERDQRKSKQESIQVRCVPTAALASTPMKGVPDTLPPPPNNLQKGHGTRYTLSPKEHGTRDTLLPTSNPPSPRPTREQTDASENNLPLRPAKDQRINDKHRRKILLSLLLSVNWVQGVVYIRVKAKATSLQMGSYRIPFNVRIEQKHFFKKKSHWLALIVN